MAANVEELEGGVVRFVPQVPREGLESADYLNFLFRFNRVTGNEQGQYVCTAENDAGSITGIVTMTIQSIPVVSINPAGSPIRTKVGQRLRLECRAKGDPAPTISWRRLRTGFLFDTIEAKESQQMAVYDIQRVSQADEGTYSCTARNEAGLTEERVQIIVEPISSRGDIDSDNEVDVDVNTGGGNIRVDDVFRAPVGGTASLRCFVTGTETSAGMKLICRTFLLLTCCASNLKKLFSLNEKIVQTGSQQGIYLDWVRSDREMPADKEIRDGELIIRNVQPSAAGEYSCVGLSTSGSILFSAATRLEVVGTWSLSTLFDL